MHLAGPQALPVPRDIVRVGLTARNVHVLLLVSGSTVLAVRPLGDVLGLGVQLVHLVGPQALQVPRGIVCVGPTARNVHVLVLGLDDVLGRGVQQVALPVARLLPQRDPDIRIAI